VAIKIETLPVITGIGTAKKVSTDSIAVTSLTLQAEQDNVGDIYVGDSNVTISTGLIVAPGDATAITADTFGRGETEEFFINEVFVISITAANKVRAVVFRRRT